MRDSFSLLADSSRVFPLAEITVEEGLPSSSTSICEQVKMSLGTRGWDNHTCLVGGTLASFVGIEDCVLRGILGRSDDFGGLIFLAATTLMCGEEKISMTKL